MPLNLVCLYSICYFWLNTVQSLGHAQDLHLSVTKHTSHDFSICDSQKGLWGAGSKANLLLLYWKKKKKKINCSRFAMLARICGRSGLIQSPSSGTSWELHRKTETNKLTKSERYVGNLQCNLQDQSTLCWLTGMAWGRQPLLPLLNF